MKSSPPFRPKLPKKEKGQNLLKFGILNISNMPISI